MLAAAALIAGVGLLPAYAWQSNLDLDGNFGYRYLGVDAVVTKSTIGATGNFFGDGQGNITDGTMTYNDGGNVCAAKVAKGSYQVISNGTGTLTLDFKKMSGSCPLGPTFVFSIAATLPNSAGSAQQVQMSLTSVTVGGSSQTGVVAEGEANLVYDAK